MYEGLAGGQSVVSGVSTGGGQVLGGPGMVGYWMGAGERYAYPSEYGYGMPVRHGPVYHRHGMPGGEYGRVTEEQIGKSKERGSSSQKVGRFTKEDDERIIDLKSRALSWNQIAEHFPGRSAGSLQVHYCTKLRRKGTEWSEDMVGFYSLLEAIG